jgi:hypothetical protein
VASAQASGCRQQGYDAEHARSSQQMTHQSCVHEVPSPVEVAPSRGLGGAASYPDAAAAPPVPAVAGLPPRGGHRGRLVGTAIAVLLARGGSRTTLQTRTPEQSNDPVGVEVADLYPALTGRR